ncbi:MAG TPA: hypothetical protein VKA21_09335 [Candidatus Binatia bacterium]|nr:hypothetical protein [Candidatus Binatia bacterium]
MIAPSTIEDLRACDFYCDILGRLAAADVPFLIGGAYALDHYTGIARRTKDIDVFIRPADCERVLALLAAGGCQTELTSAVWLAKARCGDDFVDLIFSSGNGVAEVDDAWFEHAAEGEVMGVRVRFCPPEEMIWSKGYIMERERYDGADVAHLIRACAWRMDWRRLVDRFDGHWRVLLSHLVLFGFAYPGERDVVPAWVMEELLDRLGVEVHGPPPTDRVCQGMLLSRAQYRIDVDRWGYRDGRLRPTGRMTAKQVRAMNRER